MKKCANCGALLFKDEEIFDDGYTIMCEKCATHRGRWIYDGGLVMCSECHAFPWLGQYKEIDGLPVRCPKCNTLMKNVREL